MCLQNKESEPNASAVGKGLVKIRDKNSLFLEANDPYATEYNKGIYIDVFEAIEIPNIPNNIYKYLMHRIAYASWFYDTPRLLNINNIGRFFLYPISLLLHYPLLKLLMVGKKTHYSLTPFRYDYGCAKPIDSVLPCKDIEFEGHAFRGPNNPDMYLKLYYGNYLEVPAKNKRKSHAKLILLDKTQGEASYNCK